MAPASEVGSADESQISGSSFGASKLNAGQEDVENFEENQALQSGLFGVLYTVSKEKDRVPAALVIFRLFFDVLQLWLLMVNPQYGFKIDPDNLLWQIVSFVQLNTFMTSRGYTFFLGALYIFIILLAVDVGLCIWVGRAFRSNRFDMVWPIVWLRYFSLVFFQVLDVASMTLFLMALDCRYFSVNKDIQYTNQEFGVECFGGPHIIHAVLALIALIVFSLMAAVFQMGEMELNMLTRNYLAMGHSKVEVTGFFIKFVMTSASVFIVSLKWYSAVQLVFGSWMVYLYLKWVPQYYDWVNHVRVGSYALVWYCAALLIFMGFLPGVDQSDDSAVEAYQRKVTNAMWAGIVPMFVLGWLASYLRIRRLQVYILQKFKDAPADLKSIEVFEFTDSREVELLARCCRKWIDRSTLDPDAVVLAETVMRAGLQQLPKDCYMVILYSSFLIDVQTSYQSGYSLLQVAKKLDPSFLERFAIYSREQQHTQKAAGATPGTATDLVSYVEFQRNYRLAMKVHKEALLAIRGFWQSLLHSNVKFEALAKEVIKIDVSVHAAEKTYRMVLQRHSTNVKMVRMYAKFLESCKEDPWGAAKWFAEAEHLEQQDEESKNSNMMDGLQVGDANLPSVTDGLGVIVCNAQGVVQYTNNAVCELVGYSRHEFKGRNIFTIMPSPVRENHVKMMKQFIANGGEIRMQRNSEQIVLHKLGHVVRVRVTVTRISGIGEDSVFMGVLEPIPLPPNTAHLWVLGASGSVVSVDEAFMDWTGYKVEECVNMPLTSFIIPNPGLAEALKDAKAAAQRSPPGYKPVLPQQDATRAAPRLGAPGAVAEAHEHSSGATAGDDVQEMLAAVAAPSDRRMRKPSPRAAPALGMAGLSGVLEAVAAQSATTARPSYTTPVPAVTITTGSEEWTVRNVQVLHKYTSPVDGTLLITNTGSKTYLFHVVTITRSTTEAGQKLPNCRSGQVSHGMLRVIEDEEMQLVMRTGSSTATTAAGRSPRQQQLPLAPPLAPLGGHMLVCDKSGRILHVTQGLADRLGSNKKALMANGSQHAMDGVLPQPFAQLHRQFIMGGITPAVPPPYSCRSGMAVPLLAKGPCGPEYLPFRVATTKRGMPPTGDFVHVINLEEVSMEQALGERRMKLRLDGRGNVLEVMGYASPSLFGFDPAGIINRSVSSFIDVFQTTSVPDPDRYLIRLLTELVKRAIDMPGGSYRVGVEAPTAAVEDEQEADALAAAFSAQRTIPAIMTVRVGTIGSSAAAATAGSVNAPQQTGSMNGGMPPAGKPKLCIEVELWRTDLVTSMIELDSHGCVTSNQPLPLYPPGLVFGVADTVMGGQHISNYVPLNGKPLTMLFQPPLHDGVLAMMPVDVDAPKAKRSSMRSARSSTQAGPVHMFRASHVFDGLEVDISVQAAHRNGLGGGYYVTVHVLTPSAGRPDFADWLLHGRATLKPSGTGRLRHEPNGKLRRSSVVASYSGEALILEQASGSLHAPHPPPAVPLPSPPAVRRHSNLTPVEGPAAAAQLEAVDGDNELERRDTHYSADNSADGAAAEPAKLDDGGSDDGNRRGNRDASNARVKQWVLQGAAVSLPVSELKVNGNGALQIQHRDSGESRERSAGDQEGADGAEDDEEGEDSRHPARKGAELEDGEAGDGDDDPEEGDRDREQDHALQQLAEADESASGKASEMADEALAPGVGSSDFKRGQRFKKLYHMLGNAQAQRRMQSFRLQVVATVLFLLAVHCGCFAVMIVLLKQQETNVAGLNTSGLVARYAGEIAVYTRMLNMLYRGEFYPWLAHLSQKSDIPFILNWQDKAIKNMAALHGEVYMSLGGSSMPTDFGLNNLWNNPSINVSVYYDVTVNQTMDPYQIPAVPALKHEMKGLWDLGNMVAAQARDIHDHASFYVYDLNQSLAEKSQYMIVMDNAGKTFAVAYMEHMDMMVEMVVDAAGRVNNVQMIILALEGCVLTAVVLVYIWLLSASISKHRHLIYSVFLSLPQPLVRTLATKSLNLGEDDEDDDFAEPAVKQALDQQEGMLTEKKLQAVAAGHTSGKGGGKAITFGGDAAEGEAKAQAAADGPAQEQAGPQQPSTFMGKLLASFTQSKQYGPGTSSTRGGERKSRRRLQKSYTSNIKFSCLFLAWGVMIIALNAIGHSLLGNVSSPIATFNLVNFLMVRIFRTIVFMTDVTDAVDDASAFAAREVIAAGTLEKEYRAALYGGSALPDETTPHFTLAKTGITQAGGEGVYILYDTTDCLCADPGDCHNSTSYYHTITHHGLDRLIQELIRIREAVALMTGLDPRVYGPEFAWVWNVHQDINGGFEKLNSAYLGHVVDVYQSVESLNYVSFVLTVVIFAAFWLLVLRPFMKNTSSEVRRIAELLSQLPSELDVEGLVQKALLQGTPGAGGAPGDQKQAGAFGVGAGKMGGLALSKSGGARGSLKEHAHGLSQDV